MRDDRELYKTYLEMDTDSTDTRHARVQFELLCDIRSLLVKLVEEKKTVHYVDASGLDPKDVAKAFAAAKKEK